MEDQKLTERKSSTRKSSSIRKSLKKPPNQFQLIDFDLNFNEHFKFFLAGRKAITFGKHYKTVGIIGCQSGGKSTLLNMLFDTQFEVMDPEKGRGQTTEGIWCAVDDKKQILILDFEGVDAKIRGDNRLPFEQTASLFALAISDVLIINMWTADVGRYSAANYGLFKTIFEVNLRLFGASEVMKKILFILRDFEPRQNFTRIKEQLHEDMREIWKGLVKEEKYEQSDVEEFFSIEYKYLPSFVYAEEQFKEDVKLLKKKFEKSSEESIFIKREEQNLPMDGIPIYFTNIWELIRSQKDLNLPGEKEMAANFMCNGFKQDALDDVELEIKKLQQLVDKGKCSHFKKECMKIYDRALNKYDKESAHYNKKSKFEIRTQLQKQLFSSLEIPFRKQTSNIMESLKAKIKEVLKKLSPKEKVIENLGEKLEELKENTLTRFEKKAGDCILTKSEWTIEQLYDDLLEFVNVEIKQFKFQEKKKLFSLTKKKQKKLMGNYIMKELKDIKETFWEEMRGEYYAIEKNNIHHCSEILEGLKIEGKEIKDFLFKMKEDFYSYTKSEFKKMVDNLNMYLQRRFQNLFLLDSKGVLRNWVQISEKEIDELFMKAKNCVIDILTQMRFFSITKPTQDDEETDEAKFEALEENVEDLYEVLITDGEFDRIKHRFNDDAERILEEARRKHLNMGSSLGKVPWYFWLILLYFGYPTLLSWLSSPILLYPLITFLGIIALLHTLGILGPMWAAAKITYSTFAGKIKIPFFN